MGCVGGVAPGRVVVSIGLFHVGNCGMVPCGVIVHRMVMRGADGRRLRRGFGNAKHHDRSRVPLKGHGEHDKPKQDCAEAEHQ